MLELTQPKKCVSRIHIGEKIAFWAEDTQDEKRKWLSNVKREQKKEVGGKLYLIGTIIELVPKTISKYVVEWEAKNMASSKLDMEFLFPAMLTYKKVVEPILQKKRTEIQKVDPSFKLRLLTELGDGDERGTPLDSDEELEDEDEEDDEFNHFLDHQRTKKVTFDAEDVEFAELVFPSHQEQEQEEKDSDAFVETGELEWEYAGTVQSPILPEKKTKIKKGKEKFFNSPLTSMLAFFPIEFWKIVVECTNDYAQWHKAENPKFLWTRNTDLNEMMQFFRILILMTLYPTPGRSYDFPATWKRYENIMTLKRFKSLRAALHFSIKSDTETEKNSNDVVYKIRLILNTLKLNLDRYVDPGKDVALDESSVAARSKYGRLLIFYNPSKPTGKYHFRLYLLCEADYYNCLRIIVHTKNGSDTADGYLGEYTVTKKTNDTKMSAAYVLQPNETKMTTSDVASKLGISSDEDSEVSPNTDQKMDNINNDPRYTKTTRLVLDICNSLNHKGHVVNMDNYYTSPEAVIALRHKGIYSRGTVKTGRRLLPRSVTISKDEAEQFSRGKLKYAVNHHYGLVAFGWNDSKAVHMVSSADGDDMSQRHPFKKWYKKFSMALFDYGLTNAEIHYFMANPAKKKNRSHRYYFRKELCDLMGNTDWSQFESTSMSNNRVINVLNNDEDSDLEEFETPKQQTDNSTRSKDSPGCNMVPLSAIKSTMRNRESSMDSPGLKSPSHSGKSCQICKWEGRVDTTKNVYFCAHHRIRACITVPLERYKGDLHQKLKDSNESELGWLCPERTKSCWDKAHTFYIPNGLFGEEVDGDREGKDIYRSARTKSSNRLVKLKGAWEYRHGIRASERRPPGPKKKSAVRRLELAGNKRQKTDHKKRPAGLGGNKKQKTGQKNKKRTAGLGIPQPIPKRTKNALDGDTSSSEEEEDQEEQQDSKKQRMHIMENGDTSSSEEEEQENEEIGSDSDSEIVEVPTTAKKPVSNRPCDIESGCTIGGCTSTLHGLETCKRTGCETKVHPTCSASKQYRVVLNGAVYDFCSSDCKNTFLICDRTGCENKVPHSCHNSKQYRKVLKGVSYYFCSSDCKNRFLTPV